VLMIQRTGGSFDDTAARRAFHSSSPQSRIE